MWIVTLTYKVATSLTTLGTKDEVFEIENADGERNAMELATAIFRVNEDTVNSVIVDYKVEYVADEIDREARYNLVTEYTVMVTYTIDLLPDLREQQQIFTWTNPMSHADAISKTEAVISAWKNSSTIIKMEVESAEVETVDEEVR